MFMKDMTPFIEEETNTFLDTVQEDAVLYKYVNGRNINVINITEIVNDMIENNLKKVTLFHGHSRCKIKLKEYLTIILDVNTYGIRFTLEHHSFIPRHNNKVPIIYNIDYNKDKRKLFLFYDMSKLMLLFATLTKSYNYLNLPIRCKNTFLKCVAMPSLGDMAYFISSDENSRYKKRIEEIKEWIRKENENTE